PGPLAAALFAIHGLIRALQAFLARGTGMRDADADRERHAEFAGTTRLLEPGPKTLDDGLHGRIITHRPPAVRMSDPLVAQGDDKLVATISAGDVARAGGLAQQLGHLSERLIATCVAMEIVDPLEIVDVDHQNARSWR